MGQIITKIKKRLNIKSKNNDNQLENRLINVDDYENQISELEMYSEEPNLTQNSNKYFYIEAKIDDNFEKICKYFEEKNENLEEEIKEKIDKQFLNHQEDIEEIINEVKRMKTQINDLVEENNNYRNLIEQDVSLYKSCYDTKGY